ncbi:sugar transferase [Paenibacillus abyssi]|uniref:UDP-phosphate galactose phosphotransferase n=1 Tax=Paenibacillus abyssi TaxID=1340531 RepID=A0A917CUX7_9BACL|nr:sugar transferase [Paenibacillus abyssi]GGF98519.1 hypothetical protein GCM10010916_14710 [Paenibacillus abyssi]
MTKVAHVVTSGISHKILGDKLKLLHQAGFDVTLISSPEEADAEVGASYPFRWLFVPMNRKIHLTEDLRAIIQMRSLFKRERFDVVHTHTAKAGLIGRLAARLANVPVVIHTSHGLPFFEGQSRITYTLYRWLEKLGAFCCDALASQNSEDVSVMQALAPWRKVYYEGNGVDLSKHDDEQRRISQETIADIKKVYGIPCDKPVLLMAARFEGVKNHTMLIEALVKAKRAGALGWVSVLAGKGPLEDAIMKRAAEEGLQREVFFVGQQSQMAPWMKMADIVSLTSEKEGIPRSLMEAMCYAKPVVATDVLGTRELVVHGETGELVPYQDAGELAESLQRLMSDPARLVKLGEAGRRRIEEHFTESLVVERLARIYRETAARASRQRRWGLCFQQFAKRGLDLLVCVPAFVMLLPLFGLTAALVKLKLGSPVLFRQQRPGRFGKPFHVYKFRTMTSETDPSGRLLPDDLRLTPFGRLLRRLSLDELPQLINVIRGDMSLVGPRPLLMEYLPLYTEEQARRHDVRPGITGLAQVSGRNTVTWEERFKLDVRYVDNQSLWMDYKILALTAVKVLKREGIEQQGQATVRKFTGNPGRESA